MGVDHTPAAYCFSPRSNLNIPFIVFLKKGSPVLKKVFFASAAILLGAQAAHAADIAPAAPDWTGFYLGLNGGYGGGTFDYPMNFSASSYALDYDFGADVTAGGFFGGGQIGYNYQIDNFVLGVEGDIAATNIEGKVRLYSDTANAEVSGHSEVDWFATARLRGGYAATSSLLLYVTGGFAWGSVTSGYDADLGRFGSLSDSTTNSHMGWTLGGGFEYAVTEHLSLKTEYLYIDLGKQKVQSFDLAEMANIDNVAADLTIHEDIAFSTVKAGINWRF